MSLLNYKSYDGLGLAKLVKDKEVQPVELVEEAIKLIEQENPRLNAVVHKMYEQAKNQCEKPIGGTFAGVPMLLKNITQEIKGEPMTMGSKLLHGYRAKEDSYYVTKFRQTGALLLGQTNIPEFALMGITEPKAYGPTRNPWNTEYTPGGSSGGAGAAVVSGMVPIAGANDGGGSIRIPAAYCGLFGLKPTRGRTPVGPKVGRNWQGASVDHVLTKTVRDSAAMLDELKVVEAAAAFHPPFVHENYLNIVEQKKNQSYTIAFSTLSPLGTEVDEECKEAVMKTAKLLEKLGHKVVEENAPVNGEQLAKSYMTMYFGEVAATLKEVEGLVNRKVKQKDVEPTTWLLGLLGRTISAEEFVLSLREWDKASFLMEQFHEKYDFYMTPTTATLPAKIGQLELKNSEKALIQIASKLRLGKTLHKIGIVDQLSKESLKRTPFTQLANLTGQPAMSTPLHRTESGLPVGVQFMAAKGREDILLQLASQLEQTDNWLHVNKAFTK
ncbi:amidase [Salirhabdus euzebyi]|uniref:Amidase n=1 Tax=Salirhabdus euzebyi TaxID=394506 RepID=A0A841Q5U9_9BACI|nr:amidase family protein [Salirhabdus euzebyi]MBB6453786.1 amidase [Salirhabdus euzebyi]